jgi:hypothetical protein
VRIDKELHKEVIMLLLRRLIWISFLYFSIFIFSCVTINIYFPAEKVESVAEDIVDEIRDREAVDKESRFNHPKDRLLRAIRWALLPSVAWAEGATDVSNPTIRALKQKMKTRYAQMKPYYQKKMLNEGNDGYVSLGSTSGLGLKDKRDLNNLVNAENKDRKALYAEVAKALKIDPGQVNKIAEIFAKEWQKL